MDGEGGMAGGKRWTEKEEWQEEGDGGQRFGCAEEEDGWKRWGWQEERDGWRGRNGNSKERYGRHGEGEGRNVRRKDMMAI